jgi:hypothetical protein
MCLRTLHQIVTQMVQVHTFSFQRFNNSLDTFVPDRCDEGAAMIELLSILPPRRCPAACICFIPGCVTHLHGSSCSFIKMELTTGHRSVRATETGANATFNEPSLQKAEKNTVLLL